MINTSSKTLGAQEKTQDIKQSPSTKIGTKPYARSQRNELVEAIGHWQKRPDAPMKKLGKLVSTAATERWRQINRTQDNRVRSSTERFHSGKNATGRVRWHVTGRWQCPIS